MNETLFDEDDDSFGPAESGENQEQENALPPLASGNGVNVWFSREADKNGDQYLVIDMPGHQPVRVFFDDAAKPTMNRFAESWREKRKEQESGGDA